MPKDDETIKETDERIKRENLLIIEMLQREFREKREAAAKWTKESAIPKAREGLGNAARISAEAAATGARAAAATAGAASSAARAGAKWGREKGYPAVREGAGAAARVSAEAALTGARAAATAARAASSAAASGAQWGKDRAIPAVKEGAGAAARAGAAAASTSVRAATAAAQATGSAALAVGRGGRNVTVKGFDFLKTNTNVPFILFLIIALYQIFELIVSYKIPLEIRAFIYIGIFLIAWQGIKIGPKAASVLCIISFGLPYAWELWKIPDTAEFAPIKIALLVLATSWTWWLGLTSRFTGMAEAFRWALILIIAYGIIWPQFQLISERFGFSDYVPNVDPSQAGKALQDGLKKSLDTVAKIPVAISKGFQQQIKLATGDFYTGNVDENTKKPLGVMIEKLEPADTAYFEGDAVVVWATLKAVTIDKPIEIAPRCWSDKDRRSEVQGFISPTKLEVDSFEQGIFDCKFDKGQLKSGSRRVSVYALFSFDTRAYLKSYFMDKEKLRSLRREQIDPFNFYKITDKAPVAVFTNGPVLVGMKTNDPPIPVQLSEEGVAYEPVIGVTIQNLWEGRVENITELKIELPEGLELKEDTCDHKFSLVGKGDDGYNVYALDVTDKPIGGFEKFQSFKCRYVITDASKILGGTPIAIKYFRASVSYIYRTEKSLPLEIKESEEEKPVEVVPVAYSDYQSSQTSIDGYLSGRCPSMDGLGQCISDVSSETGISPLLLIAIPIQEGACKDGTIANNAVCAGTNQQVNNLYGIKCGGVEGSAGCCQFRTQEEIKGALVNTNAYFRAYKNKCDAVKDFADLVSTAPRYAEAMSKKEDPNAMVTEMRKAGYATSSVWDQSIIQRMNEISSGMGSEVVVT